MNLALKSIYKKNDAHVASAPADLVALKACALASSIIFLDIDFNKAYCLQNRELREHQKQFHANCQYQRIMKSMIKL